MAKMQIEFSKNEDYMIEVFQSVHGLKRKDEAVRKMIKISFSKEDIKKKIDKVNTD